MNPTNHLSKTLLATSISALLAVSSLTAFALDENDTKLQTYTDPVTGELKVAPRLLSQMSDTEKAALTEEQRSLLEEVEALINQEQENRAEVDQ